METFFIFTRSFSLIFQFMSLFSFTFGFSSGLLYNTVSKSFLWDPSLLVVKLHGYFVGQCSTYFDVTWYRIVQSKRSFTPLYPFHIGWYHELLFTSHITVESPSTLSGIDSRCGTSALPLFSSISSPTKQPTLLLFSDVEKEVEWSGFLKGPGTQGGPGEFVGL